MSNHTLLWRLMGTRFFFRLHMKVIIETMLIFNTSYFADVRLKKIDTHPMLMQTDSDLKGLIDAV